MLSALARCCLQSRSFRGSHDRSRSHRRLRTPGAQVLIGPSPVTSTQQVCSPLLFPLCCAKPSIRTLAPCPVALTPPPSAIPHPATIAASRRRRTARCSGLGRALRRRRPPNRLRGVHVHAQCPLLDLRLLFCVL